MKRSFFLPILFFIVISTQAQNTWVQRDTVNGLPKSACAAFTANGEGYVVSGLDYAGFTRKMYSYNVIQNDWDNELSMGGLNGGGLNRGSATAFSINNKGYVCTGQGDNTNFLKDNWEYDPLLDVWTQKADFPGSARRAAVSFVIDNIAYVGTGEDATGLKKDFYKFDPSINLWGNVADFVGTARKQAVGFSMGNQGYVGTGYDGIMRNDFWQYLVFQNSWIQKANFPGTPRAGATGWGIFPTGFIATGEDNNFNYTNDVWEYNFFSNQWIQRASLPGVGRKNAISFVLDSIAYLGTGYNGTLLDDFYAYTGIVGEKEQLLSNDFVLFPNPVVDNFSITSKANSLQKTHVEIYSIEGKNLTSRFSISLISNGFDLKRNDVVAGIYLCSIYSSKGILISTRTFIVR